MKALVINDIAGRQDLLEAALASGAEHAVDALLVLGGFSPYGPSHPLGDQVQYAEILTLLGSAARPVYIIPGQRDRAWQALSRAVRAYHGPGTLYFVHRSAAPLAPNAAVAGFGGTIAEPDAYAGPPAFPAWEARGAFLHMSSSLPVYRAAEQHIFLFAMPPYAWHIDQVQGQHRGSRTINMLAERYHPDMICCAGPAEAAGTERIAGVPVLNPGCLAHGMYAIVDLDLLLVQLDHLCVAPGVTCVLGSTLTGFAHTGY